MFREIPIIEISLVIFRNILDVAIDLRSANRWHEMRHLLVEIIVWIINIKTNSIDWWN